MWRSEQRARGCRPSTVAYREKALGILAKFWDGPPEALTPALLLQWREALTDYGYAVATVNGYLRAVRAFCNWLVSEGVLAEAPRFRLLSERDTPDPQVYSATDLAKLMKGTAGKQGRSKYEAIRDAAIIALLQDSGLRASECAGLLLENIDLDARQAY